MTPILRATWMSATLACIPTLAAAQTPATPPAQTSPSDTVVVRGTPITVSLVPSGAQPLLVARLGAAGQPAPTLTIDDVAQAIGQVLDQLRADKNLPTRFTIQLGSMESVVLPLLQSRLAAPGANWDVRTGNARHGSAYRVLPGEALAAIDGTPLASVFTMHRYRLSAGGAAERVEVGLVSGKGNAILPTSLGYVPIAATTP